MRDCVSCITAQKWHCKQPFFACDIISEEEKKALIASLVEEVRIYPEGERELPLKSMKFNFPVYKDGQEIREIFLNEQASAETLAVLSKKTR